MIDRIRIGVDILDPEAPKNQWETEEWIRILCATNTVGRSEDRRAITTQVYTRFRELFSLGKERYMGDLWEIFYTKNFNFWNAHASAHAIVCHLGGDMSTQDYTRAREGLEIWLGTMHTQIELDPREKERIMSDHVLKMQGLDPKNTDSYLTQQERIIRDTRLKLNPLMRIPLMASGSPEDCAQLFQVMEQSRANLVVYMLSWSRELVSATLLQFPQLRKLVPALADEELQFAA